MKANVGRNVKILSLGFLLIFFGLNGVQQYVTTFFGDAGLVDVGFRSLILIYMLFALFDPLSAIFVSRHGAKKCMIVASLFYSLFIVLLLSRSTVLIYLGSSLVGIAASLLWTGQNSYLIRASDKRSYGENSGFFNVLLSIGSAAGIFAIGLLIPVFLYDASFLAFSAFPLLGIVAFLGLKDLKSKKKTSHFKLVKKSITSTTALRLSSIWFAINFIFGLVIGIIPIQIKNVLGIGYVGILSSLIFAMPIFLSYFFGRLSDTKGRKMIIILTYVLLLAGLASMSFSSYAILLVSGIVLLALARAIITPVTYALVGDVATGTNLEFLTALFWMVQNIGVVAALIVSQVFVSEIAILYMVSIFVVMSSLIMLLPIFRMKTEKIREKISLEMK